MLRHELGLVQTTVIKKVNPANPVENLKEIDMGAAVLKAGGLVAFPTETVYGLGANALSGRAAEKIFAAKGRPADNPLIVHIAEMPTLFTVAAAVPPVAEKLIRAFWPGPLTVVLDKTPLVPAAVSGGLQTVAVRWPKDKTAQLLIKRAGIPVAAPSANASGRPSPTSAAHVMTDLSGKIDMIIDGGDAVLGLESTVVDARGDVPVVLRPGSVTLEMIRAVCGVVALDPAVSAKPGEDFAPSAPGQKYTHYAPKAKLTLFSGDRLKVAEAINSRVAARDNRSVGILCTDATKTLYPNGTALSLGDAADAADIGANLYKTLREFDRLAVTEIYGESFPEDRTFLAVMNRLKKAAGYHIIHVD